MYIAINLVKSDSSDLIGKRNDGWKLVVESTSQVLEEDGTKRTENGAPENLVSRFKKEFVQLLFLSSHPRTSYPGIT